MKVSMRVIVRTSSGAALKEVAILMNVESMLKVWLKSSEGTLDAAQGTRSCLAEVNNPLASFVWLTFQDADSLSDHVSLSHLACLMSFEERATCEH